MGGRGGLLCCEGITESSGGVGVDSRGTSAGGSSACLEPGPTETSDSIFTVSIELCDVIEAPRLCSASNFASACGWRRGEPVGERVEMVAGLEGGDCSEVASSLAISFFTWLALGDFLGLPVT